MRHILIIFLISVVSLYSQNAANSNVLNEQVIDLNMMMEETQLFSDAIDKMTMVWWIPNEYWLAIAEEDPLYDISLAKETIEILNPYIVTFILKGKVGVFGGIKYEPSEIIYEKSKLLLSNHHVLSPIDKEDIEPDVKNFMDIMKPMFSNMMGAMGENMHFVLFDAKYQNGDFYINSKEKGHFTVKVSDESFRFTLPLASLFPKKICPVCEEELNSLFSYCPYDGVQLK